MGIYARCLPIDMFNSQRIYLFGCVRMCVCCMALSPAACVVRVSKFILYDNWFNAVIVIILSSLVAAFSFRNEVLN